VTSIVGDVLAIVLTAQAGGPVIFTAVVWSLSVLHAALGLYSSWALRGEKCDGMNAVHRNHTLDEEAGNRESALDRTIEASFPASDPPSSIPNPDEGEQESRYHVDKRHRQENHANRR
jgi:hypothetical protein